VAKLPKRAAERVIAGLKKYQPILTSLKARDVNESDTVVIVTDLLHDLFGYDKYSEITSEHMIKSTFCDLAINLDNALALLVEVKAIGLDLKENHVRQAVDYAANKGCEWVCLTNGVSWQVYKVCFTKPIQTELVVEFNVLELNSRNEDHVDLIGLLAKEGWQKANLGEYHSQRQALSRFTLGAILLSEPVLDAVRKHVRKLSPDVKVDVEEIRVVLEAEVLKREVLEGEKADAARKQIARAEARKLRDSEQTESAPPATAPTSEKAGAATSSTPPTS